MRMLIYTPYRVQCGIAEFTNMLIPHLMSKGVEVIIARALSYPRIIASQNHDVIYRKLCQYQCSPDNPQELLNATKHCKPDWLIIQCNPEYVPEAMGWGDFKAPAGTKLALIIHSLKTPSWIQRSKADKFIALHPQMQKIIPHAKYIPMPCPEPQLPPRKAGNPVTIATVGFWKSTPDAVAFLRALPEHYHFHLIGSIAHPAVLQAVLQTIQNLIRAAMTAGLTHRLHVTCGYISTQKLIAMLNACCDIAYFNYPYQAHPESSGAARLAASAGLMLIGTECKRLDDINPPLIRVKSQTDAIAKIANMTIAEIEQHKENAHKYARTHTPRWFVEQLLNALEG